MWEAEVTAAGAAAADIHIFDFVKCLIIWTTFILPGISTGKLYGNLKKVIDQMRIISIILKTEDKGDQ